MKKSTTLLHILIIFSILLSIYACASYYQTIRYKKNIYDCTEMSRDCYNFFNFIRLDVYYITGYNHNYSKYHRWIGIQTSIGLVEFESTNLMFTKVSDKYYNCIRIYKE